MLPLDPAQKQDLSNRGKVWPLNVAQGKHKPCSEIGGEQRLPNPRQFPTGFPTWLVTNYWISQFSPLGKKKKIDSFEIDKIKCHKCWKRPKCFAKKTSRKCSHHKNPHKKQAHGRKETCSICYFYCMTHFTRVTRYRWKVNLVTSEVTTQFSHSFIYFEVGHRQIFPGLESSSFPEGRKSWNT